MPRLSVSRVTRVRCRNKAAGAIARIHERASSRSSQTSTGRVTEIANDAAPKRHGGSRDPLAAQGEKGFVFGRGLRGFAERLHGPVGADPAVGSRIARIGPRFMW